MQHKHLQFPKETLGISNNIAMDHLLYKNSGKGAQMLKNKDRQKEDPLAATHFPRSQVSLFPATQSSMKALLRLCHPHFPWGRGSRQDPSLEQGTSESHHSYDAWVLRQTAFCQTHGRTWRRSGVVTVPSADTFNTSWWQGCRDGGVGERG